MCPQQTNHLTKHISNGRCRLITFDLQCQWQEWFCVPSACARYLKALPASEHHIFHFKVTEE